MNNKEFFRAAQFGLMMHFGLYTLPAGEWKGQRIPYIGEWLQAYYRIPNAEYHELARAFNPIFFDAEAIVKVAKAAGMKYVVMTAKHHEGFALFKSRADRFNVVDATPFGRDVIAELAEACDKHGMRMGLYYSQEIDWAHPHGGGYRPDFLNLEGTTSWTNDWDYPDNDGKDYSICFEEKILPQLDELLTNYGNLFLLWCDTPGVITPSQSRRIYDLIKSRQPDCLVNSRLGNGAFDYVSAGDNQIPLEKDYSILYESPATLNDTWGYKSFDENWKSPETVAATRNHLRALGANYLLNVGPDPLGRLPAPAVEILEKVGQIE